MGIRIIQLLIGFFLCLSVHAQEKPRFFDEIEAFRKQDSISMPAPGQVLFIGSSSFTNWKDVQEYFPGTPILNRAFGASSIIHLIQYQHAIIYPYKPGKIVIYCGENDFAENESLSAEAVVNRFRQLFSDIRSRLPDIPIVFVSIKPSPSRRHLMPKFLQANLAIQHFLKSQRRTFFVDVYAPMLLPGGNPNPFIFLKDSLHMNASGYRIWQHQLRPVLKPK